MENLPTGKLTLEHDGQAYEFDNIEDLEVAIKRLGSDVVEAAARKEYYENQLASLKEALKKHIALKNNAVYPLSDQ